MSTIIDLMLSITERRSFYYHKDTNVFDDSPLSKVEMKTISTDERIPFGGRENDIKLPSYQEINHNEIMRFYVRECVENKEQRKKLFYILRRHDYMSAYIDALHELELYDDFIAVCGDIYIQIFDEWAEENGLKFR